MFCAQCGSNIKDTANFCKYCGAKVKKSSTSSSNQTQAQKVPEPKQPTPTVEPPRIITKEESLFSQPVMTGEPVSNPNSSQQTTGNII